MENGDVGRTDFFFFSSKIQFRKLTISKHVFSHLSMLGSGDNTRSRIDESPCCQE